MEFEKKIDIDDIRLNLVSQKFNTFKIEDVRDEVFRELDRLNAKDLITPNMKIAITAGSRGISNIPIIMKAICDYIKDAGGDPFIVPSMGSHGGATAEGQRHVLTELGITEESMGCPILSSMDVVKLGETDRKVPVYMDKNAYSADGIVVVNRIKPHTDFNSDTESGLLKMIAVGLGNAKGCATMHSYGLRTSIPATAKVSMKAVNIMFGLGIVENSRDETYKLKALLPEDFEREEKELLKEAKEIVPKLPTDFLDLLIVKEMGKMISGTGMDTKVIGRIRILGEVEPEKPVIKKLVILNLSEASYGNALGVGLADITTKKLVESIDFEATYANTISTTFLERGKIPITMSTDKEAIQIGLNTVGELDAETVKVGIIENTLDLQRLYLSDAVLKDIDESKIEVLKRDIKFLFDEDGNLII
jgi:hypothetical protein